MRSAWIVGILVGLAFGSVVLAAGDSSNISITWDGSGSVGGTFTAGSTLAITNWRSAGTLINGTFTANYNVGGGPYGGNSYIASIDASVTGGGFIEFYTIRGALGYTSGGNLEPGGQFSYSYIASTDIASMKTRTSANAVFNKFTGTNTGLFDQTYGWVGPNEHNFFASGTYVVIRRVVASNGNYAEAYATGSGTASLDVGCARANGLDKDNVANLAYESGYLFGWNQDFNATGTGQLILTGVGSNQVVFYNISQTNPVPGTCYGSWTGVLSVVGSGLQTTGTGTFGSAALQIVTEFLNGLTYPNISITAK